MYSGRAQSLGMTQSLPNPYWRLSTAVERMATGTDPIQRRLCDALLNIAPLLDSEFPTDEQKALLRKIKTAATAEPPAGDEGSIETTVLRMDDEKAKAIATDMCKLLHLLVDR